MSETNEKDRVFDPRIQTEDLAFDAGELIDCSRCGRSNPPNRLKCLYCGRELEVKAKDLVSIKPTLRKLESWERGFNVIVVGRDRVDAARVGNLLSVETSEIAPILDHEIALPLARVESEKEAYLLQQNLAPLGLKCSIVRDVDLDIDKPPVRLSRIDLSPGQFTFRNFNTGELIDLRWQDLALIVSGILVTGRVEALEKKRRRGNTKLLDETVTGGDEMLLDLYSGHDKTGFRVHLAGFDFSCLGEDKGLLAAENMRRLIIALKENAPNAKLVPDYSSVRHALDVVWPIESRKDPQGLRRSGFGKVEFGSVASTSNLGQFTRFSRMQWHLL